METSTNANSVPMLTSSASVLSGMKPARRATITLITGAIVAVLAGFIPLSTLAELVNIGTLFAFVLVSIGVIILRRTRPDLHRSFRVPGVPVLPVLSVLACFYLMLNLPGETWIRFGVWMVVGVIIYFAYGRGHSRFNTPGDREDAAAANAARRG